MPGGFVLNRRIGRVSQLPEREHVPVGWLGRAVEVPGQVLLRYGCDGVRGVLGGSRVSHGGDGVADALPEWIFRVAAVGPVLVVRAG